MTETNGKPVIIPEQAERKPYRPTASTEEVHDTIARSLSEIVSKSAHQASIFVSLFELYDKDESLVIRYGHLVDAAECLDIAMTHLGQLRTIVANRLNWEEDGLQNARSILSPIPQGSGGHGTAGYQADVRPRVHLCSHSPHRQGLRE